MRRRVVITGMGVICPLGKTLKDMFQGLTEGRSGVGPITRFDAHSFPTRIAAEVKDYQLGSYVPNPQRFEFAGPNTRFALGAARLALDHAGLSDLAKENLSRFGVYLGSGEGIQDFHMVMNLIAQTYQEEKRAIDPIAFTRMARTAYHPQREYEQELHTPPGHVAREFGMEGPNYNCLTSCAAGSQAVGEATQMIRLGEADLMLAGGTHSMIHPLGVTGFCRLTAMSTSNDNPTRASRPFDAKRDGFVLGEGAAILVLEELEHAKRRGATIHAEITGYGVTADAFRLTDSHPEGRNSVLCVQEALRDCGLSPGDIGYINAHGTSTQLNDRVETLTIKKVFGDQAKKVPISSTKSMMGHLIAAAGSIETIICVLALQQGVLPPTINYEFPDPECDLDYIPNQAREKKIQHAMTNSFGFGGQNTTLIVSQFEG